MTWGNFSFYRRTALAVLVGSVLAAAWFHISGIVILAPDVTRPDWTFMDMLLFHVAVISAEAAIVVVAMICIGLPAYFLARRFGMANSVTAIISGLTLGLLVSVLYGGPDFSSVAGAVTTILNFGASGVIAAFSLWYFMPSASDK